MKISTTWLKNYVAYKPPVESVADRLTMAGLEVKGIEKNPQTGDTVFDIEITSNRPDWLSHIGVAREIAAIDGLKLNMPELADDASGSLPQGWRLGNRELGGCPYYTGLLIEGIEMNATPNFIREALLSCGLRPVNLIVDITNFVLLETGQPLHAFDADHLNGKEIQIRRAKKGEKMLAINGDELELDTQDLVIADSHNAAALAGIMGGKDSEVSDRTKSIFLESAFFNPSWVRQASRRHGLSSDSSYRFERRVDPAGVNFARWRAVHLIRKYAGCRYISNVLKSGSIPAGKKTTIHLKSSEISGLLGTEIKSSVVSSILARLGLEVKTKASDGWTVGVPTFRPDLKAPVDLIEEVARIYGFDKIPDTLPARKPIYFEPDPLLQFQEKLRNLLSGWGLYETVTFSMVTDGDLPAESVSRAVPIVNPMHKEMKWMRPSLIPSLLPVVEKNAAFGARRIGLFEIAHRYHMQGKSPREEKTLAIVLNGLSGEKNWMDPERPVTFFDLKGLCEELLHMSGFDDIDFRPSGNALMNTGSGQELWVQDECCGYLGEVADGFLKQHHLEEKVYAAELFLDALVSRERRQCRVGELPRFPAIERDIAVVVPEDVEAGRIIKSIESRREPLIAKIEVFDVFRGGRVPKGHKNLAFRLTYQSSERTLLSDEIQGIHEKIAEAIAAEFQAAFQQ